MADTLTYKIFLVDDDMKHLLLLKDHLEGKLNYNLTVETFKSGEEVLPRIGENPDLVILDYYLDSDDENTDNGITVLQKIKKKNPTVPVIMMSQQDKVNVVVECFDFGAKDYIAKNETAYARGQIVTRNIIQDKAKEIHNQELLDGANKVKILMGIFIVILILALIVSIMN